MLSWLGRVDAAEHRLGPFDGFFCGAFRLVRAYVVDELLADAAYRIYHVAAVLKDHRHPAPRRARAHSSAVFASRSRPSKTTEPPVTRPLPGRQPMTARITVVFPLPLSPTIESISPASSEMSRFLHRRLRAVADRQVLHFKKHFAPALPLLRRSGLYLFREPVVVAWQNLGVGDGLAAYHVRLGVAEDYRRRVVEQYLLHLDDELAALRGVELDCEPVAQRVELRVAVSASVLRVASVYVRLPVLVDEDLGVSGLRRKDIRDKQVVFAAYPDAGRGRCSRRS